MTDERKGESEERVTLSGREVRQGEIILRTPLRRTVFIAGLVGFVILAALMAWWPG
jgi:hypothetical protein